MEFRIWKYRLIGATVPDAIEEGTFDLYDAIFVGSAGIPKTEPPTLRARRYWFCQFANCQHPPGVIPPPDWLVSCGTGRIHELVDLHDR